MIEVSFRLLTSSLPFESIAGYVGPGAGLTMLGALLAVLFMFLLALLAPCLYLVRLVRSMLGGRRARCTVCADASSPDEAGS